MSHYVCLVTFTQEGLKNLKATTKRAYDIGEMESVLDKVYTPYDLVK